MFPTQYLLQTLTVEPEREARYARLAGAAQVADPCAAEPVALTTRLLRTVRSLAGARSVHSTPAAPCTEADCR